MCLREQVVHGTVCECLPHVCVSCCMQEWTGESTIGDALVELADRLPRAKMIITTQGAKGSICLCRTQQQEQQVEALHTPATVLHAPGTSVTHCRLFCWVASLEALKLMTT